MVPIKAFSEAKLRLAPALSAGERSSLAMSLAGGVLDAARSRRTAVVCDDDEVADWAASQGVEVFWAPGRGLNLAVAFGVAELARSGSDTIIVVHGDILDPSGLEQLEVGAGITLVPDLRDDGTNVICLPARARFEFSYGPGSFRRHLAAAEASGLEVTVLRDEQLGHDVDRPGDLPAS